MLGTLVLDASILKRAVLGKGARRLLDHYGSGNDFTTLSKVVASVDSDQYGALETEARLGIARRDVNDWPVLAAALSVNCPTWTEDIDFFGCGVATWASDRVELYLAAAQEV